MNLSSTVNLHLYAPRAHKRYDTKNIFIKDGKIHVKSLLVELKLKSLYLIGIIGKKESETLLQYEGDG